MAYYLPWLSNTAGDITPSISATKTSGPAPFGIVFDATGTTCNVSGVTDPWRQLHYAFDYGDSGSGNWTTTGNSKNTSAGGPIGAHVYDTGSEGTKTCTLTVTLGYPWLTAHTWKVDDFVTQGGATYRCLVQHLAGTFATDLTANRWVLYDAGLVQSSVAQQITVQNADTVYAGALTVCIDPDAVNTGGPAGCSYVTSFPSTQADDTRYLFKKGKTYTNWTVNRLRKRVQIGAYNSGARPIFAGGTYCRVSEDAAPTGADKSFPTDISIFGLDFHDGLRNYNTSRRLLVHDCRFDAVSAGTTSDIRTSSSVDHWSNPIRLSSGWASTDFHFPEGAIYSQIYARANTTLGATILGDLGITGAVIGYDSDGSPTGLHNLRSHHGYKILIENCKITGDAAGGSTHWVKLHSAGLSATQVYDHNHTTRTELVMIQANHFGGAVGDNLDWAVTLRPQSDGVQHVEQLTKCIVANNLFDPTGISQLEILLVGSDLVTYGNSRTTGSMRITAATSGYAPGVVYGPYFGQEI